MSSLPHSQPQQQLSRMTYAVVRHYMPVPKLLYTLKAALFDSVDINAQVTAATEIVHHKGESTFADILLLTIGKAHLKALESAHDLIMN